MSDTAAISFAEAGYKQAAHAADQLPALKRWLESSGPWLKLAMGSADASDLVSNYRIALDVAAAHGGSKIFLEVFEHQHELIVKLLGSGTVPKELAEVIALDLKRADALISQAATSAQRRAKLPNMLPAAMTSEAESLLKDFAQRMNALAPDEPVRKTFTTLLARIKPDDYGWAAIADLALDRAARVKRRFPSITRATYKNDSAARKAVDVGYASHGKGELFEHLARNSPDVKDALDGELRAAAQRAAQRGAGWSPVMTVGELRLGTAADGADVARWPSFADGGVLVVALRADASPAAALAGARVKVNGVGEATALFEFKAERGVSDLPNQQERAMPRMIGAWAEGKPVYAAVNMADESGQVSTKVLLLKPPDSKAGLSYYGAGTSNAFIETREILAAQGANVRNINLDVSNSEMRAIWDELFWAAFESL